jgi:acetyl-CoA C-acetyltransferase
MLDDSVVIVGAKRTPMGAFLGELAGVSAPRLGAVAIAGALEQASVDPDSVDEVLMGNVLSAGLGQAPARQAALAAGMSSVVPCTTVSKVCGSGMKAVMLACDLVRGGSARIVVAGGMESMSNAPYLLPKARAGHRIGHDRILDHMMLDGLEDAYEIAPDGARRSMGTFGEDCAEKFLFTRAMQDEFAIASVTRALEAAQSRAFANEIAPVDVSTRSGLTRIDTDEGPRRIKVDKISALKPAFKKNGTITAASSSSINDGAAALVVTSASEASARGLKPLARVVGCAAHAQDPSWFTTAPIYAMEKLYAKTGWKPADVDLFEINEAFAVVPMAAMKTHGIPHEKMNVYGGACALGHPIGCSGARILVTLLTAMQRLTVKRGVASICIGGGEATAIALEMIG